MSKDWDGDPVSNRYNYKDAKVKSSHKVHMGKQGKKPSHDVHMGGESSSNE